MSTPVKLPTSLKSIIEDMEYELHHSALVVYLSLPLFSSSTRYRRVSEQNVEWYRVLCSEYLSDRKHKRPSKVDTKIKRRTIERVLRELIEKGESKSKYAQPLLDIASSRESEE